MKKKIFQNYEYVFYIGGRRGGSCQGERARERQKGKKMDEKNEEGGKGWRVERDNWLKLSASLSWGTNGSPHEIIFHPEFLEQGKEFRGGREGGKVGGKGEGEREEIGSEAEKGGAGKGGRGGREEEKKGK
jgi:hypothetical protein